MDHRNRKQGGWSEWLEEIKRLQGHDRIQVPSRFTGIPGCCLRRGNHTIALRRKADGTFVCAEHEKEVVLS